MPRPLPDVAASHPVPRQGAIAELEAWHRLVICGRPEQVGVARAFVRQVLGAGHPGLDRVTLLTSELVTNSVNHSDSRLDGGTVTVTVRSDAERVHVEVTDDGASTTPTISGARQDWAGQDSADRDSADRDRADQDSADRDWADRDWADDLAEGGRGLLLVEAYSLMWDYYRDGTRTVTWFECLSEPLE